MPGRSIEEALVAFGAPTLMGVKAASLFRCPPEDWEGVREEALRLGRELAPYGLGLRVMRGSRKGGWLMYLYHAERLRKLLAEPGRRAFLARMGYPEGSCAALLEHLESRLCPEEAFPHEIGVFLDYPLEDVVGFIENHGRNYTCCGYWKAYGDPKTAEALFDRCRKCTAVCKARYHRGARVSQLIAG